MLNLKDEYKILWTSMDYSKDILLVIYFDKNAVFHDYLPLLYLGQHVLVVFQFVITILNDYFLKNVRY